MYRSGIDYFTPAAGSKQQMECVACQDSLDKQPDVLITKGRFGQPYNKEQQYIVDVFSCRNAGVDWHSQIIALLREIDHTASQRIASLLESEIAEIRKTRVATKKLTAYQM